jgi:Rod binding domain-containing protein
MNETVDKAKNTINKAKNTINRAEIDEPVYQRVTVRHPESNVSWSERTNVPVVPRTPKEMRQDKSRSLGNKRPAEVPGSGGDFSPLIPTGLPESVTGEEPGHPLTSPSKLDPKETAGTPVGAQMSLATSKQTEGNRDTGINPYFKDPTGERGETNTDSGEQAAKQLTLFASKPFIKMKEEHSGNGKRGVKIPYSNTEHMAESLESLNQLQYNLTRNPSEHNRNAARESAKGIMADLISHVYHAALNPNGPSTFRLKGDDSAESQSQMLSQLNRHGSSFPSVAKGVLALNTLLEERFSGESMDPTSPKGDFIKEMEAARKEEKRDAKQTERDLEIQQILNNARKLTGEDKRKANAPLSKFGAREWLSGRPNASAHIADISNDSPLPVHVLPKFMTPSEQLLFQHTETKHLKGEQAAHPGLAQMRANILDKAHLRYHREIGQHITDLLSGIPSAASKIPEIKTKFASLGLPGKMTSDPAAQDAFFADILARSASDSKRKGRHWGVAVAKMKSETDEARRRGIHPRNLPLGLYHRVISMYRGEDVSPEEASEVIGGALHLSDQRGFSLLADLIAKQVDPGFQTRYLANVPMEDFMHHAGKIRSSEPSQRAQAITEAVRNFVSHIPSSPDIDVENIKSSVFRTLKDHAEVSDEERPLIDAAIKERWVHGARSEYAPEPIFTGPASDKTFRNAQSNTEKRARLKTVHSRLYKQLQKLKAKVSDITETLNPTFTSAQGSAGMTQEVVSPREVGRLSHKRGKLNDKIEAISNRLRALHSQINPKKFQWNKPPRDHEESQRELNAIAAASGRNEELAGISGIPSSTDGTLGVGRTSIDAEMDRRNLGNDVDVKLHQQKMAESKKEDSLRADYNRKRFGEIARKANEILSGKKPKVRRQSR